MRAGYDGNIRIDSSIDSKGFNAGIKGMIGSLRNLAIAVGIAFSIGAIITFGKTAVNTASQIESAYIGLESIVTGQGKSYAQATKYIQDYISDGLVPATNAVTAYKNLLMRGYSSEQIETVMNALKNASAFGRQASLTMGEAVQSATEGLKNENSILVDNSGVTKNVSMMWKDYAESIGTTVGALTKAQKIEAEVQGILEETRFQMNDASKLSQTYAGRLSALGVSFMNLKVSIGNSIIPIINQVVPYIKAAIDSLTIFFNRVALIMNTLFGTSVSLASGLGDVADGSTDAADAQDDLANSIEDTQKAAKGALAAFDQLNVLQSQTPGSASSSEDPADNIAPILPPIEDTPFVESMTALQEKVLAFKAKFLEFIQPVIDALLRLKESLTPLGETIWAGLKWAWDNILVPLGEWVITDLLPVFLDLLGSAAEFLNEVLLAMQPSWEWFWENVLKPLAEWVGGVVIDFLNWLADALVRLSDWMEEHGETYILVLQVLGAIAGALWLLNAAVGAINVAIGIYNSVMAVAAVVTGAVSLPLLLIIALILAIAVLIYLLITRWDELSVTVQQIGFIIEHYFNQFMQRLATTVEQLGFIISYYLNQAADAVKARWEELSTTAQQLGFIISYYIGLAADAIKQAFFSSLDAIRDKFESVFNGIKSFIASAINGIIDIINNMIAGITDAMNAVSATVNAVGTNMPGFTPWPVFEALQIPRLATGAVIPPNSEFAAILGDHKSQRELLGPEDMFRRIVREETSNSGGSMTVEIPVYLDGDKLFNAVKRIGLQRGKNLAEGTTS